MPRDNYKATHIDCANGIVKEVTITGLADLQRCVGGLICFAHGWDNGDVLFVDDEGLLKGNTRGFEIQGAHQPFMGSGVIVGREVYDDEGECIDQLNPTITVDLVRQIVAFGIVRAFGVQGE